MSRWASSSLVTRIAILFGLTACLVTGSLGTYFFQTARASVEEHTDQLLVARAEHFRRVVADMQTTGDLVARPVLFEAMLGAERDVLLFRRPGEAPFIRVNPDNLPVPDLKAVPIGRITTTADVHHGALPDDIPMHWVAATTRTAGGQGPIEVIAGHPMNREMRMIGSERKHVILATIIAMVASILLAYLLLRRGMQPL
jgi:two-component system heavy metal sensor histidine kinase CusS